MRGHITKKGSKYHPVLEVGHESALRCESCGRRAGWASEVKLDACPRCSGELVERSERRQRWLQGHNRKKDAQSALSAVVADADRSGAYIEPSKKKLGAFLTEDWIPGITSTVRPSTAASYASNVQTHIVPRLGHLELRALSPGHLNRVYSELSENGRKDGRGGLSPKTVRYIHTIIHRALRDAVRWGLLSRNVADLADPPKHSRKEMSIWSAEQLRAFLASVEKQRLHPCYLLASMTGMRRGEILGLRWQDVDLESGRLQVRQTLTSVDYKIVIGRPKTARSNRSIALDPATVQVLRTHRKGQLEERLQWGTAYEDSELVFCRENGTPTHPQSLSQAFERDAKAAGLPLIRFHDLRHSYATVALSAGVHPKVVSERLGHSSIAVTLDTYSHVIPALEEEAATRIAALILGEGRAQ